MVFFTNTYSTMVRVPLKELAIIGAALCSATSFAPCNGTWNSSNVYPYQNANLPVETRVNDLLSRMTFLEKLAQTRNVGGILNANATYNHTAVDGFNAPYGGGSICKSEYYIGAAVLFHTNTFESM